MTDQPDKLALASEFPATSAAQWRALVDAALKGADFDKRLVSRSYDDIRIEPLYPRAPGAVVPGRAASAPWAILQRLDHPDPAAANAQALHDLENGATGLLLVTAGSVGAHGYGLDGSQAALSRALDGIYLDAGVIIETDLSTQTKDAGLNLAAVVKARGVDPAATDIRFAHDPLGLMARAGVAPRPWTETTALLGGMVDQLAAQGFKGPFVVADGRAVHDAGGSEAQELAFVIGNAVAYLRLFADRGVPLDRARRMIFFRLAADADEFLTIAKFRALRKLWTRVETACGVTPEPATVTAETAWRMMTARDPYVNMLRATIAVTAAALGGANAISVLPFTAALGLPDPFARRVARNTQLILLEESNLARVTDPAAGAGGLESLTDALCRSAWALFQEIEAKGGAPEAIVTGFLQDKIAKTRAARAAAVAKRREPLTGASEFPHLGEAAVTVLDVPRATAGAPAPAFTTLPAARLSEPFEVLRNASDTTLAKTGARPKVFLANLGKPSDFTARTTFAKNFYEAGGIEAVGNDGFKTRDDMIAAFKASEAKLACLCSSDEVYGREAVDAAKALAAAGATVHLAGRPGEHEAAWRAAGIDTYIFAGGDVLATLQAIHARLGVS
ncbi:MAG: methylmalonyl-CoA mutase subunit beta [Pseudolabrys sp.]|nr:methylmalonyl-CoA mutase subunit beta [Pseudolabrys sp.]